MAQSSSNQPILAQPAFFSALTTAGARAVLVDATNPASPTTLSGTELAALTAGAARMLQDHGLRSGQRVAVMLPNGGDFSLLYLACMYAGITIVPANPDLPDEVLTYILDVTHPALLVTDAVGRSRLGARSLKVWQVSPGDIIKAGASALCAPPVEQPEAMYSITFTSGTTSRPKGVCHLAGSTLANVDAFNQSVGIGPQSRMLHVMPMAYMAGYLNTLLSPLLAGGVVILGPQFDAGTALGFWQPAMHHMANTMWLTPTMCAFLVRMNRDPQVAVWTEKHLPYIFIGTAPLPLAIRRAFEGAFGTRMLESFGMTEIMLASGNSMSRPVVEGSVGHPIEGVHIEARSPEGVALHADMDGELWVRSRYALAGYLNDDVGGLVSPLVEGWLPTGDVGHVDRNGNLFITGRIKDLIIRGGTNVSPRAVEDVLLGCRDVKDIAVVGVPHPFWGEEVVAFVEVDPEVAWEEIHAQLKNRCRSALQPAAVPNRFIRKDSFPRSVTGKVQKAVLRQELTASGALAGP